MHPHKEYAVTDKDLLHRLISVLRVQPNDHLLLFDATHHVTCTIIAITKKEVTVRVLERQHNTTVTPKIIWLLPLLEREDFEEALYVLTAMGATEIYPVITQKSRQNWGNEKERERAMRIMVAAAEQSKQFVLPTMQKTVTLQEATKTAGTKLFFDAQGQPAYEVITQLQKEGGPFLCLVGPEGDLTEVEKELVRENNFIFCKLTPTILRASHAVTVGMGLLRSCL